MVSHVATRDIIFRHKARAREENKNHHQNRAKRAGSTNKISAIFAVAILFPNDWAIMSLNNQHNKHQRYHHKNRHHIIKLAKGIAPQKLHQKIDQRNNYQKQSYYLCMQLIKLFQSDFIFLLSLARDTPCNTISLLAFEIT
mgnify:CR=1 FL=1